MFQLQPQPTFEFTAPIPLPGGKTAQTINLIGRHKGRKALLAWKSAAGATDADGKPREDVDYLMDVVVGWGPEVQAPDGSPAAFTRDTFEAFLDDYPLAGNAIFIAYLRALTESQLGN